MKKHPVLFFLLSMFLSVFISYNCCSAQTSDAYQKARKDMVAEIESDVISTSQYINKKSLDPKVMEAIGNVHRHEYVPDDLKSIAYKNRPLPIGYGQTISQPYIVALMTDLIQIDPDDSVLEIGTGSGYQAAVLAQIAKKVFTIEIVTPLFIQAKRRIHDYGLDNVFIFQGDGYYGREENGPFDAIIVTAAASHIPPPLLKQLKPGGKMVIPVGSRFMVQQLIIVEKKNDGKIQTRQVLPVRFVPLTGTH